MPGELASYGKTISFTVTLKTPTAGDAIKLSGKSTFFEYGCDWDYTNVATATTALTASPATWQAQRNLARFRDLNAQDAQALAQSTR